MYTWVPQGVELGGKNLRKCIIQNLLPLLTLELKTSPSHDILKNMKHILENLLLDGNLLITNQIVLPKIFSYR